MTAPAQAREDGIIADGFPEGWFVQDRPDENTALLVMPTLGWPGSACLCLRPKLVPTDEWVHLARETAWSMSRRNQHS